MFSLIITIISIALVAALAVATIFYGGSAFNKGSAKAAASTLVSQAQQIAGAEVLYQNDNGALDTSTGLTGLTAGGYLTNVPAIPTAAGTGLSAWAVASTANGFTVSTTGAVSKDVCDALAKTANTQVVCTTGTSFSYAD